MLAGIEMGRAELEAAVGALCHDGASFKGQERISLTLTLPVTEDSSKRKHYTRGFIRFMERWCLVRSEMVHFCMFFYPISSTARPSQCPDF
jgi:hypothetical protein